MAKPYDRSRTPHEQKLILEKGRPCMSWSFLPLLPLITAAHVGRTMPSRAKPAVAASTTATATGGASAAATGGASATATGGASATATTPSRAKRTAITEGSTPTSKRKRAATTFAATTAATDTTRKGSFPPRWDPSVPTHTLLLGTQPSDNSLQHGQYFMTNENAFWHIVGDALGFRRGFFVGQRTAAPEFIRPHLLHTVELGYDEAMAQLLSSGYAMWDIVASSVRPGSLDSDIKEATYADVAGFVTRHAPVLERIVFSTGAGSANIFLKAHRKSEWFATAGAFRPADDEASRSVFGAWCAQHALPVGAPPPPRPPIELVVVESVSPASNPRQTWSVAKQAAKSAARLAKGLQAYDDVWSRTPANVYCWKRADWFKKVFDREPAVRAAPPLGALPSHLRDVSDDASKS